MLWKVRCQLEWGGQLYDGFAFGEDITPELQEDGHYTFEEFPNFLVAKGDCTSVSYSEGIPASFLLLQAVPAP